MSKSEESRFHKLGMQQVSIRMGTCNEAILRALEEAELNKNLKPVSMRFKLALNQSELDHDLGPQPEKKPYEKLKKDPLFPGSELHEQYKLVKVKMPNTKPILQCKGNNYYYEEED